MSHLHDLQRRSRHSPCITNIVDISTKPSTSCSPFSDSEQNSIDFVEMTFVKCYCVIASHLSAGWGTVGAGGDVTNVYYIVCSDF